MIDSGHNANADRRETDCKIVAHDVQRKTDRKSVAHDVRRKKNLLLFSVLTCFVILIYALVLVRVGG